MPHFVAIGLARLEALLYTHCMLSQPNIEKLNFRVWLQSQFTDRGRKNPRYSIRSFAVLLAMDPSSVSQILAGKRVASRKVIQKICERLSVPPNLAAQFLIGVERAKPAATHAVDSAEMVPYHQLAADAFSVISDWHHYAILELTYAEGFQSNERWIAKMLGISPAEALIAIQRLERLELLETKRGRLVKTDAQLTNGVLGSTNAAMRELQRQVLKKALSAIDECPPEEKDITSMTMTIDPTQLPEARLKIQKFRRELCTFLEAGKKRTRVYNLGLQLYPVSASTNRKD